MKIGDKGYVIRPIKYAGAYAEILVAGAEIKVKLLRTYVHKRSLWQKTAVYQGEVLRLRRDEFRVTEPVDGEA